MLPEDPTFSFIQFGRDTGPFPRGTTLTQCEWIKGVQALFHCARKSSWLQANVYTAEYGFSVCPKARKSKNNILP